MKKIVCPSCGKVNYEAFVTFPHCAECGALLPDASEPASTKFWQRPVGTLWWISLLGIAAIAVAFCVTLLAGTHDESDQLLVYGSMQRNLYVGSQTVMKLTLDTVSEGNVLKKPLLQDVELRLPREVLQSWTLVSIEPPPKSTFIRGDGAYYQMGDIEVNNTFFLTWKARQAGDYRFTISIFASEHSPVRYVANTLVRKERRPKKP